jgi:hypothetical protein
MQVAHTQDDTCWRASYAAGACSTQAALTTVLVLSSAHASGAPHSSSSIRRIHCTAIHSRPAACGLADAYSAQLLGMWCTALVLQPSTARMEGLSMVPCAGSWPLLGTVCMVGACAYAVVAGGILLSPSIVVHTQPPKRSMVFAVLYVLVGAVSY